MGAILEGSNSAEALPPCGGDLLDHDCSLCGTGEVGGLGDSFCFAFVSWVSDLRTVSSPCLVVFRLVRAASRSSSFHSKPFCVEAFA